jgi:hypothetical protein
MPNRKNDDFDTRRMLRDWKSPLAQAVRTIYPPYYEELAALKQAPEAYAPAGLARR